MFPQSSFSFLARKRTNYKTRYELDFVEQYISSIFQYPEKLNGFLKSQVEILQGGNRFYPYKLVVIVVVSNST